MIQAMIFDLDGTLVKTEWLKALSYAKAAALLNPDVQEAEVVEAFKAVVGLSRSEVAQYLVERFRLTAAAQARMTDYSVETPWQAYIQIRLAIYEEMLTDPRVLLDNQWPHNVALLHEARRMGCKVGLATMSYCPQVQRVLTILDWQHAFDFVASRDDVEQGKPDPEIYRMVARQLGVDAPHCLVIEDSPTGVKAALAAGMHCIAVTTPFTREAFWRQPLLPLEQIVDDPAQLMAAVERILKLPQLT